MKIVEIFYLVLYVIPGFLAIEIYRTKYPAKKTSDTTNIIWSIICTVIILCVLGIIGHHQGLPDLNYFDKNPRTISLESAVILLGSGFFSGLLLIAFRWIRSKLGVFPPNLVNVWAKINFQQKKYFSC